MLVWEENLQSEYGLRQINCIFVCRSEIFSNLPAKAPQIDWILVYAGQW
jgi:hypothetical protein